MSSLQQQPNSPLADLCTEAGRRQADSIIVSFFSADSPTGMFQQLPIDVTAQQALLSSVDRQLPLGGKDIHYTSATTTTSKKCDVHCKTNKAEANNTS